MRRVLNKLWGAILCIAGLTECNMNIDMEGEKIFFDVESVESKGSSIVSASNMETMCVSAYEGSLFSNSSVVGNFFKEVEVRHVASAWITETEYYYPFDGYVSFFAFAPFIQDKTVCSSENYSKGFYSLEYSPPENVTDQVDFCVAKPVLNKTKSAGPVQFQFQHVLSSVSFSASYEGELQSGLSLKVDELILNGLVSRKILQTSDNSPYFFWSSDGSRDRSYVLMRSNHQLTGMALPLNPASLVLNGDGTDGMLFLLPQKLTGSETLTVKMGWYDGDTKIIGRTLSLSFPPGEWTAGEVIKYHLKLQVNQFTLSVDDWGIMEINGTISE